MIKRNALFCFIFLFSSQFIFAQKNLQKGLIVNNQGDTLRGFVDQKEWGRNPESILFASTLQSSPTTYSKKDISYFQIDGKAYYKRFIVSMSMDVVSIENVEPLKDPAIMDTVFLKTILKGKKVSIYTYNDKVKKRYYMQENGVEIPQELVYRMFSQRITGNGTRAGQLIVVVQDTYRDQLLRAATNAGVVSEALTFQIKKTTYGDGILDVAQQINGRKDETIKVRRQWGFDGYVGAGENRSTLKYSAGAGGTDWYPKSSASNSPYIAVGMTLFPNRDVRKTAVKIELSWNTASFHTTAANNGFTSPASIDYTIKQTNIGLSANFQYSIYRTTNLSFNILAGFKINRSSYPTNNYSFNNQPGISDFFLMTKNLQTFNLGVGLMILKRVEIVAAIQPPLTYLNGNTALWAESLHTTRIGVNYVLWKK